MIHPEPMFTAPQTGSRIHAHIAGRGTEVVRWDADAWRIPGEPDAVQPTAWWRIANLAAIPNEARMRAIMWHSELLPQAWVEAERVTSQPDWIRNQAAAYTEACYAVRNLDRNAEWRDLKLHTRPPAAQGALMALLGWDDCGEMLGRPVEELRAIVWSGGCEAHYRALLLAPAVIAMGQK